VGVSAGMTNEHVERVYADIDAKRKVAYYLHSPPVLVDNAKEVTA
jgi:hypothetical protein